LFQWKIKHSFIMFLSKTNATNYSNPAVTGLTTITAFNLCQSFMRWLLNRALIYKYVGLGINYSKLNQYVEKRKTCSIHL